MRNRVSVFLHFWVRGIVYLGLYHQVLVLVLVQELVGCFCDSFEVLCSSFLDVI